MFSLGLNARYANRRRPAGAFQIRVVGGRQWQVYGLEGKLVAMTDANGLVDVRMLQTGIYLLQNTNGDHLRFAKQ
jgi:hypothetical protein